MVVGGGNSTGDYERVFNMTSGLVSVDLCDRMEGALKW